MADFVWVDDQAQPLPRSARQYLHSWVRAEELALNRWNAEVVIFEVSYLYMLTWTPFSTAYQRVNATVVGL